MAFDSIPTQLWLVAFQLGLNALAWWVLARLLPEERGSMAHWAGFMLCLALGLFLAGARDDAARSWWTYNAVNVVTLLGFALMRRGTERFLRTGTSDRAQLVVVLPWLVLLVVVPPSESWAPLRAFAAYASQSMVLILLLRAMAPALRREFAGFDARALLWPAAAIAGFMLFLALRQLPGWGRAAEMHQAGGFNQGLLFVYLGGSAMFGFGFLQLVALRLTHQLREASQIDGLTQLLNRRALEARLREAWLHHRRRQAPLALLMIDVDHFKRINDSLGHAAGDSVLQTLAQLLRSSLRGGDLVGRIGGEEFLLVLPETDDQAALALAERLRERARAEQIGCTLSVGVSVVQPEDAGFEQALLRADAALYRAKAGGRDRVELA
jgi:diguanylate cyclase (GGDEF)-like protein